jgi:1,4-alpha-glucan branching enzyme
MLSTSDIEALVGARHADPFAVLGFRTDAAGRHFIRAMLPGAAEVSALDAADGAPLVTLAPRDPSGLFEAQAPCPPRGYRLQVRWHNGDEGVYADAYGFGPQLTDADIAALSSGSDNRPFLLLGAHLITVEQVAGVRFAVWAPNASRVSVVGDFNAWDGRRHPMRLRHDAGVWELFIPHVAAGDRYKYELRTHQGAILPLKSDPYGFAGELRPATASRVAALPPPRPLPPGRAAANARDAPVCIYEVHPGSWRRRPDGSTKSWDELAAELPAYVAELGFTHIELMPVSEYPFDGSWGYQTLGMYAPTARFGPVAGFGRFVAACHAQGLGLLVDWVPAHFPSDAYGLARFDGTALYEYGDPREGFHKDWNTLIYNFGRNEVRQFLIGSAVFWLERLGVDGLRVDAVASMLYRDYSRNAGEWVPNVHGGRENLEAIALLRRVNEVVGGELPGAITVAEESTAFTGVSRPVYAGGLGFHYKWNMGWMHDTLDYMMRDPAHRRWHHGQMSFGLVYAFTENFVLPLSHDEVVHGKGSLLGKMPGDRWQKFANLRAYYGFMWTHPGKKLLFMGGEFAQDTEWNHDATLPWHLLALGEHAGVRTLVKDLNALYRARPALHATDCEGSGFEWISVDDADQSLYIFLRKGPRGELLLVLCNFTPVPRHDLRVGVPDGPWGWREVLNTDSAFYGGSNVGNGAVVLPAQAQPAHGRARSVRLVMPPLATVVLEPAE